MGEIATVKQTLVDIGVEDETIEKMYHGKSLQSLTEYSDQDIGRELNIY